LIKQEKSSIHLIANALANASTSVYGTTLAHVKRSAAANALIPDDFHGMGVLAKRLNPSWYGGTPEGGLRAGITDALLSPEMMLELKRMGYNPINTRAFSTGTDSIAAPDSVRAALFNAAGIREFMGVNLLEFGEFGVGQRYNAIFDELAGSTTYPSHGGSGSSAFDGAAEEIIIFLDRSRDCLFRANQLEEEASNVLTIQPDDQFFARQKKVGYYANMWEGRLISDDRGIMGLIV
jgi:hypothetical protein